MGRRVGRREGGEGGEGRRGEGMWSAIVSIMHRGSAYLHWRVETGCPLRACVCLQHLVETAGLNANHYFTTRSPRLESG